MRKGLIIVSLMMVFGGIVMPVADTYADGVISQSMSKECEKSIFGMRPWYAGLVTKADGKCVVGTPAKDKEAAFVWTIVLNVLFDMFAILGVVSTGFIICGGYWYLRSGGDPNLVARGKKTIQAAIIGTGLALMATLVTNLITTILTAN